MYTLSLTNSGKTLSIDNDGVFEAFDSSSPIRLTSSCTGGILDLEVEQIDISNIALKSDIPVIPDLSGFASKVHGYHSSFFTYVGDRIS